MVYFQHGHNANCRIETVGPNGAIRPLEISTGWGNNIRIVVRQYEGSNQWTNIRNELTLLNASGNTIFPWLSRPRQKQSFSSSAGVNRSVKSL